MSWFSYPFKITPFVLLIGFLNAGCTTNKTLHVVTVKEFKEFVAETNYVTDAEKFGWSIVQEDILNFEIKEGVTWQLPYGVKLDNDNLPVTQVSYHDAVAYCKWSDSKLPTYDDYWSYVESDSRKVNINSDNIQVVELVNVVGNVWDITTTENKNGEIRLAGGSYLCSKNTCDGSNPNRKLFVDKTTGNSNIGFSVIK